jgi:ribosomal protein S17E
LIQLSASRSENYANALKTDFDDKKNALEAGSKVSSLGLNHGKKTIYRSMIVGLPVYIMHLLWPMAAADV